MVIKTQLKMKLGIPTIRRNGLGPALEQTAETGRDYYKQL